jgi:chloramphenicol-sensitive protein RarD
MTQTGNGLAAALTAFLIWGVLPIYWKALGAVPPEQILCHRLVWSVVVTGVVLALRGGFGPIREALHQPRALAIMIGTGALISTNWFTYIFAVNTGHVVESSMGYYINPLVNVLLGAIFFRERLNRRQAVAIGLAVAGVMVMVIDFGRPPWIALILAFSFGTYGMLRKLASLEALQGLFCETLVAGIPAAAYLLWVESTGTGMFLHAGAGVDALLIGAGVVTSLPLLCFAFAVRKLRLTTVGIMQYIAPTCMFLLGVFAYREPFGATRLATFCLIWAGVAVYVADGLIVRRAMRRVGATAPR